MKCTWASMKPGTTIMPSASITRVALVTALRISALEPAAVNRSAPTASASAHGRRGSPVQMRALTTASVGSAEPEDAFLVIADSFRCNDRHQLLVLGRVRGLRARDACPGPRRVSPQGPRSSSQGGGDLDGGMGRARDALRGWARVLLWTPSGPDVPHRLPDRRV